MYGLCLMGHGLLQQLLPQHRDATHLLNTDTVIVCMTLSVAHGPTL